VIGNLLNQFVFIELARQGGGGSSWYLYIWRLPSLDLHITYLIGMMQLDLKF
jgi:hypothetical protein